MDGARLSRFPHLSWLGFGFEAGNAGPLAFDLNTTVHSLSMATVGRHSVRWIHRGREARWTTQDRCVTFVPARDDRHEFVVDAVSPRYAIVSFAIPRSHVAEYLRSEHSAATPELERFFACDDRVLGECMAQLTSPASAAAAGADGRLDEAARRLILRLVELSGGGVPDWHDDESIFDRRTLAMLVERIDAHLRIEPGLADLAPLVALSPSHFARKFRLTTGLSLQRFVNRRRLARSLDELKAGDVPLATLALDLGFSSQSHFTRLFRGLVGMTPARYRRQFRRLVG